MFHWFWFYLLLLGSWALLVVTERWTCTIFTKKCCRSILQGTLFFICSKIGLLFSSWTIIGIKVIYNGHQCTYNWMSRTRAEEFGQNYVRSAANSVDKSKNSPQFSYIILRWMRWIFVFKFNAFSAKLCKKWRWIFRLVNASCRWSYIFSVEFSVDLTYLALNLA